MNMTPGQLAQQLKKTVVGQDGYIKDLCTAVWLHNLRYGHFFQSGEAISQPKQNILCLGKSGTGKTLAVQALGKALDLPVLVEDASELRGSGWKGTSVSSIIMRASEAAGNDENRARHTIVVLDEFDKIFTMQAADTSFCPTSNLLTFMGGAVVTHTEFNQTFSLDTSNMLFICLVAFDGLDQIIKKRLSGKSSIGFGGSEYKDLPEKDIFKSVTHADLHEYGIPWELLGRIPLITTTNDLSLDDFKRILTDSQASPIKQYDYLLSKTVGAHVAISDPAACHIAQTAHGSRMGARGLNQTVSSILAPAIYNVGNNSNITKITLDLGQDGLYVRQECGEVPRKQHYTHQKEMHLLSKGAEDILKAVPFQCIRGRNEILGYSQRIKEASEDVGWHPISLACPQHILDAAVSILCIAICTQLMDTSEKNPNMYMLYQITDNLSPDQIAHDASIHPLNQMKKEFLNMALERTMDFGQAAKIAKRMIKEYAYRYIRQPVH